MLSDKWHDVDIRHSESKWQWKKRLAAVVKENEGSIQHISDDQLTDDSAYCDVLV